MNPARLHALVGAFDDGVIRQNVLASVREIDVEAAVANPHAANKDVVGDSID
jgi:hypothetical protein